VSSTSVPRQGSCNNKQILSKTRNGGILKKISCTRVSSLTPRKRKLYYCNRVQQGKISKLNKLLSSSKSLCKKLKTFSHSSLLQDIEKHFDATGATFLKSQFVNIHRKNPSWSLDNKVFALALYKRGPKCYRFLSRFIKLPSKSTISKFLQKVPFQTGINMQLFEKLKTRVSKMSNVNKLCSVMFDEISLATNLTYCKLTDSIIGYEDLGTLGRTNSCANHALVFMVQSIYSGWKQPVAYYFTKDSIKSKDLRYLIREVIEQLQLIGITVACTVCDQGPTNRGALKLLKQESSYDVEEPFFSVNQQKIVSLYDAPHLLKSIRNALARYTIKYRDNKVAKFSHLISAFRFDQTRRFQTLRKIRKCYLLVNKYKLMKMKVSIAAKTLSNTMAAAIETMIAQNTGLSSGAIDTAEFVHDINDLFDSFNSSNITKKHAVPPLRIALTRKTQHIIFWNGMLEKIRSWEFHFEKDGSSKRTLPCKEGWINNIKGVLAIWDVCKQLGFKFLRTRLLNQDPLENMFSVVRQYGVANTNPSCFQFISALKTSILNNLISNRSAGRNCEEDTGHLLHNLRDFLSDNDNFKPLVEDEENELLHLNPPEFDQSCLENGNFEL
jgi:hypothetical protein